MRWRELGAQVRILATQLRALGVLPGDRVVSYMPNVPETAIAMMATTAIGAVWSSAAPEFGVKTVIERFSQIEPKVLFARSEEHTSELQSLMRISYAVFCLKKKKNKY